MLSLKDRAANKRRLKQTGLFVPRVNTVMTAQVTSSATPLISMKEAYGQWEFFIDGSSVGTFTGQGGLYIGQVKAPLTDGLHVLQAFSRGAGPVVASVPVAFLVDTAAPPSPTAVALLMKLDDKSVVIEGLGSPGFLILLDDPTHGGMGGAVVETDGTFRIHTVPLAAGSYSVTAVQRDPAGNASAPSLPVTFTI